MLELQDAAVRFQGMRMRTWISQNHTLLLTAIPAVLFGLVIASFVVGPIVGLVVPAIVRAVLAALFN